MELHNQQKTSPDLSTVQKGIIREAFFINILIIILIGVAPASKLLSVTGGFILIFYLLFKSLLSPTKALFLFFGTKLTFDALWFMPIPFQGLDSFKLIDLYILPLLGVIVLGPKLQKQSPKWPLIVSSIYIIWIVFSMVLNDISPDVEIIFRQSGIFLGLFLGLKYLKDQEHFNLFLYLVFVSTVMPIIASVVQLLAGQFDIQLFYYKLEASHFYRPSGLYYDAGTAGMVNIISLLSNAYLLQNNLVKRRYKNIHMLFIPVNFLIIISGGTRSMIVVAFFIIAILFIKHMRQMMKILLLIIGIVILLGKSSIDPIVEKSYRDIRKPVEYTEILNETDYRTMFTGRVAKWQDIWNKVNEGTMSQKLFGSGMSSNAHSSYFYLLLQIGWLGLIGYIAFNLRLMLDIFNNIKSGTMKTISLLALSAILLIGFSLTTVIYTSFQWLVYLILGSVLNMQAVGKRYSVYYK